MSDEKITIACLLTDAATGRIKKEMNVQSAYGGPAADRIKEILNKEKEMTNNRKTPSPDEYIRRCHPSLNKERNERPTFNPPTADRIGRNKEMRMMNQ